MNENKKYKVYFFDYLWWLGEKAQEYYNGQPRRPDGESIVMMYIMFFLFLPILFLSHEIDSRLPEFIVIIFIPFIFLWMYWLQYKIWNPYRRKVIMNYYYRKKFSPFRAYFALFFPILIVLCPILIYNWYAIKPKEQVFVKLSKEEIIYLRENNYHDTIDRHLPRFIHER